MIPKHHSNFTMGHRYRRPLIRLRPSLSECCEEGNISHRSTLSAAHLEMTWKSTFQDVALHRLGYVATNLIQRHSQKKTPAKCMKMHQIAVKVPNLYEPVIHVRMRLPATDQILSLTKAFLPGRIASVDEFSSLWLKQILGTVWLVCLSRTWPQSLGWCKRWLPGDVLLVGPTNHG